MRIVRLIAVLAVWPPLLQAQVGSLSGAVGRQNTSDYGGHIHYTHTVRGQYGFTEEAVTVLITAGRAACTGGQTSDEGHKGIVGDGLFHVEFVHWGSIIEQMFPPGASAETISNRALRTYRDSLLREHQNDTAYRVEFSCPGPRAVGGPAPPAVSWSNMRTTYPQPGGPRWANGRVIMPDTLRGTWSIPAPETDGDNGVSGIYSMTWLLCRGCLPPSAYRPQ